MRCFAVAVPIALAVTAVAAKQRLLFARIVVLACTITASRDQQTQQQHNKQAHSRRQTSPRSKGVAALLSQHRDLAVRNDLERHAQVADLRLERCAATEVQAATLVDELALQQQQTRSHTISHTDTP